MPSETWQWIVLFGLVAISFAGFVAVSIWAWRDNTLLFRHIVKRTQYYYRRVRRRIRMWRDAEYRTYAELVDRYEGSVLLMHGLYIREEACKKLSQTADNDKERRFFNEQFHSYRDARLKCQPHVVKVIADMSIDDASHVACYLAGLKYEEHWFGLVPTEKAGKIQRYNKVVHAQRTMVQSDAKKIIDAILLLGDIEDEDD